MAKEDTTVAGGMRIGCIEKVTLLNTRAFIKFLGYL
jgi:hypothetical protein